MPDLPTFVNLGHHQTRGKVWWGSKKEDQERNTTSKI